MSNVVSLEFGNAALKNESAQQVEAASLDEVCNTFITKYPQFTDQAIALLEGAHLIEHRMYGHTQQGNLQAFAQELEQLREKDNPVQPMTTELGKRATRNGQLADVISLNAYRASKP